MNNPLKGSASHSTPWNKGKLVGQKAPLRVSEIWAIRVRLEIFGRARDMALFNLAIDSKLRGVRLGPSARQRYLPWKPCSSPSQRDAAEDQALCHRRAKVVPNQTLL